MNDRYDDETEMEKTIALDPVVDAGEVVDQTRVARHSWFNRLYTGTGAIDLIGRRKVYFAVFGVLVLISVVSMVVRGFTLGIDFKGGSQVQFPKVGGVTTQQVEQVFSQAVGRSPDSVQTVGSGSAATFQIRSQSLSLDQSDKLQNALFTAFHPDGSNGKPDINAISASNVSASWGGQITKRALWALGVFLVLVSAYIAIRYERDMAIAALASLILNMVITAGIYSIVGFEVQPETVIGLLTILGFSLYDSVVVFDKVEENTRGVLQRSNRTYGELANLAVNQTLMRSVNTTLIGVLPVLSLLIVAAWMLGVGTLKDLALVQLVGLVVGTCSSVFFASPMLVTLKERWGPTAAHTRKVLARRKQARAQVAQTGFVAGSPNPVSPAAVAANPVAPNPVAPGWTGAAGVRRGDAKAPGQRQPGAAPRPGAKPTTRPTGKRRR
jgi:preprotein translocase subunit SecF